jgi:hypothetical protein
VECGLNTGCVKVYKKSPEFDAFGSFIPLHKRGPETELFRGIPPSPQPTSTPTICTQGHPSPCLLLEVFLLLPLMIPGSLPALFPCHLLSSTQTTILESATAAFPLFLTLSIPLLSLVFNRSFANWVIAIYAPMFYTPVHNVLDKCISITRASGRGLGPGNREFFWPSEMASASAIWGPKTSFPVDLLNAYLITAPT